MTSLRILLSLTLVIGAACTPDDPLDGFEDVEEEADLPVGGKADNMVGPIVVTEVGDHFVELRNDSDSPVDLTGYYVSFSYRRVRLEPHLGRSHIVEPGALAVMVDADTPIPARVPADAAVVDTTRDIEGLLQYSKRLIVRTADRVVTDRIDARAPAVEGIAVERERSTRWELSPLGATPGQRNALHGDEIQVHFSLPQEQAHNPLPDQMAAWIDGAELSVDAALYQLDHPTVVDALVDAAQRGVAVRLATDSEYLEDPGYAHAYDALVEAGIAVVGDERTGRQHNKFLVRDGRSIWTGSFNPVVEESVTDNVVTIDSRALAAAHTAEVDEMFAGNFGPAKRDGFGHEAYVDGARVRLYFSPTDSPKLRIIEAILNARHSIYFSQFSFYDRDIGAAMLEAAERGVEVRGVFDRRSASWQTQYQPMVDAGLDVRRPYYDGLLHNKVVLIDYGAEDPVVITGSYNLSSKASTTNDESVLIINDRHVARAYYDAWRRIYDGCSGPNTDTTDQAPLAISEVYIERDGAPFVELANLAGDELALGGLTLRDREGQVLPLAGSVDAAGRAAIAADDIDLDYADALMLVDERGRVVATFDDPAFPGQGKSLEREDLAADDIDASWAPSDLDGGTPGW